MDYHVTVGQLTATIKEVLEFQPALQDVWVLGEVSSLTRAASGHIYFTLKDEEACLNCVMWKSAGERLGRLLQNGGAVLVHGRVSVYEPRGVYQFYVDGVLSAGVGQLYREFEALKDRLQAEGLFDRERKRPVPSFPRRIGVVTSASGAAFQDILNVLRRRYPVAEVVLSPTLVQGPDAPAQIVRALRVLNERPDIDVIIVARGGGALEELWAFNDERVARAIFASGIPVVSGVGHETDFTIADFVADVRAPTPSAAAEIVCPDRQELRNTIWTWRSSLARLMRQRLDDLTRQLHHSQHVLGLHSPQTRINTHRQHVDQLLSQMNRGLTQRVALERSRRQRLSSRLEALNPQATLDRGYAIVSDRSSGLVVHQVGQVASGESLVIRVSDGHFGAVAE